MPSLALEDFWVTLLCHGGSHFYTVSVNIAKDGSCIQPLTLPAEYRWYPRSLLKTLLLVSGEIL